MSFVRRHIVLLGSVFLLVMLALVFEGGRYSVYVAHPELSSQDQANQVLSKVSKLIQLPQNETPTMATINDAAAAKQGQPFLSAAQNGDVLIVYQATGEALLYRPSTDKLIAVGPVENNAPQGTAARPSQPVAATSTNNAGTSTSKK